MQIRADVVIYNIINRHEMPYLVVEVKEGINPTAEKQLFGS